MSSATGMQQQQWMRTVAVPTLETYAAVNISWHCMTILGTGVPPSIDINITRLQAWYAASVCTAATLCQAILSEQGTSVHAGADCFSVGAVGTVGAVEY